MKYKFLVSQDGIKRSLADMFTRQITFLTELCQNAQRAGATRILIGYDEETRHLTIDDNGCGFSDDGWESFFTVGRSGWSQDVITEQNPFGIGCAACLFAATDISIRSGWYQVTFTTDSLLAGGEVERIKCDDFVQGSVITLTVNPELNIQDLLTSVPKVFEAFPLPIILNNVPVKRPLALDSDNHLIDCELGKIFLLSNEIPKSRGAGSVRGLNIGFILQGFKLTNSSDFPKAWIHLHAGKYRSRVPDRTCLVGNVREIKDTAEKILASIYRQQLVDVMGQIGFDQFLVDHWFEAKAYAPDLIKDAPIPGYLILSEENIPYASAEGYCNTPYWYDNTQVKLITKEELEGVLVFDMVSVYGAAEDGDHSFTVGNYAFLGSNHFIDSNDLPSDHWLREKIIDTNIQDDNALTATIAPKGQITEFNVSTAGFYNQSIVLCDSFDFHVTGLKTITGADVETLPVNSDDEAIWFAGTIYIPAKRNCFEAVCRQSINFDRSEWNDFDLDEDYLEKVVNELWSVVRIKRGGSLSDLLSEIINSHKAELNVLADGLLGKEYTLAFSTGSDHEPVQVCIKEVMLAE